MIENILISQFKRIKQDGDVVSNREVFYIMKHFEENFKTQEECDSTLAKLISEDKIDKELLFEDDYFKFNNSLRRIMKEKTRQLSPQF